MSQRLGWKGFPVAWALEAFCDGVEIGTVLFHSFKISNGILRAINHHGGYGLGLERLASVINGGNFLESVERYALARKILARKGEVARLSIFDRDVLRLFYGLEALAVVPSRLSTAQKRLMQPVKLEVKRLILDLGLSFGDVKALFSLFQHWKD